MPSTNSLPETLKNDYKAFHFELGENFEWSPPTATITYVVEDPYADSRLLHELSHAILKHQSYDRDIDLIAMERDAWQYARMELAPYYKVVIESDIIHHDMNTYRDWLHGRSTCPYCNSNGIQTKKLEYQCVTCRKSWHVNEARTCSLRRYKLET